MDIVTAWKSFINYCSSKVGGVGIFAVVAIAFSCIPAWFTRWS